MPCSTIRPDSIHQDQIGVTGGGQPVRDHEAGPPWRNEVIARWISTSVRVSTELVTSSMIRMAGRTRKARSCSRYRDLSIGGCSSSAVPAISCRSSC